MFIFIFILVKYAFFWLSMQFFVCLLIICFCEVPSDCLNDWLIGECMCVKLERVVSDGNTNTATSSSTPADNSDNVTSVDDGDGLQTLISTDLGDTDTAAAAADDQDDDVISRNLQKRQSVVLYF